MRVLERKFTSQNYEYKKWRLKGEGLMRARLLFWRTWVQVPAPTWWLTTTYSSTFRGPDAFFPPLQEPVTHAVRWDSQAKHSHIQNNRKTNKQTSQRLLAQALFSNFSEHAHFWKNSDTSSSSFPLTDPDSSSQPCGGTKTTSLCRHNLDSGCLAGFRPQS